MMQGKSKLPKKSLHLCKQSKLQFLISGRLVKILSLYVCKTDSSLLSLKKEQNLMYKLRIKYPVKVGGVVKLIYFSHIINNDIKMQITCRNGSRYQWSCALSVWKQYNFLLLPTWRPVKRKAVQSHKPYKEKNKKQFVTLERLISVIPDILHS